MAKMGSYRVWQWRREDEEKGEGEEDDGRMQA
jgi:hypothetical protein